MAGGDEISYRVRLDLDQLRADVSSFKQMVQGAGASLAGSATSAVAGGIVAASQGRTFTEGAGYAAAGAGAGVGGAIGGLVGAAAGGPGGAAVGQAIGAEIGKVAGSVLTDYLDKRAKGGGEISGSTAAAIDKLSDEDRARKMAAGQVFAQTSSATAAGANIPPERLVAMFEQALTRANRVVASERGMRQLASSSALFLALHKQGR